MAMAATAVAEIVTAWMVRRPTAGQGALLPMVALADRRKTVGQVGHRRTAALAGLRVGETKLPFW